MPTALTGIFLLVAICMSVAIPSQAIAQETASTVLPSPFDTAVSEARSNMMASPPDALAAAERAAGIAAEFPEGHDRNTALATASWLQSEALTRLGRPAEAGPVARTALEQLGEDPEATKLYADILLSLGRTEKLLGRHGDALEIYQQAYGVYQEIGETRSESIVLQSIGSIYNDARQFERAAEYFLDATERFQDPSLDLAAFNNLGNAYTELRQYDEALTYYNRALAIAAEMNAAMLEARILNNIASLQVAHGEYNAADMSLDAAFARAGDPSGAEWARFMWGVRAQAAHGRGEEVRARNFMERTFEGVPLDQTNQHFTEFHGTAVEIFIALEDWESALAHLQAFKRLEDEGREFAASANAALVGAQFDFAEQEIQIQELRAAGLENALQLARTQARQRQFVAAGIAALFVLLLLVAWLRVRVARERQRALEQALYTDSATGLPTRSALIRQLREKEKSSDTVLTVVAIELDRHTHLEGVLGFKNFAELQAAIARRLSEEGDYDDVALVSPGLFALYVESDDEHRLRDEAELIRNYFTQPIRLDNLDIDVAMTIGMASDEDPETGLKNAIIAIQQARAAHTSLAGFDAVAYGDPSENLTTMSRMLAAMENGDMALHYQPKLNLRKGQYLAAESLCRWTDPERGFIPPDTFIPQAEETGHIRAFTEWALNEVVEARIALKKAGHDIDLAVNISGALVADIGFARKALDIVERAPGGIVFEVTETAMMHDAERALENFDRWADAGVKIGIDDYGSGFSSLAYLKRLPSSELKLDRMFITNIAGSERDRTLVKSTIDLAHNLGLQITAEGVETEEALALLKLLGCDWAQGYLMTKALPLDDFSAFLDWSHTVGEREIGPARTRPLREIPQGRR
ncbi:EAL domain-containing protein [Hyphobacterium sp. Y6023]|uniref:EAL domain-containing protein n=1 Tax=Hyphobacterium marinum TaxID=3116574 RepID=A0ABU7LU50_9PROT|nr:EAL domain-containing protein [Hyphobacterium sp. Y6023]